MIPIKPRMGAVSQWILQPIGMVWVPEDVNIHTRGTGQPLCAHYLPMQMVNVRQCVCVWGAETHLYRGLGSLPSST